MITDDDDDALQDRSRAPVSVVIPFYNDTKTIRRAVLSAFEQEFPPEEVIIVDDGSATSHNSSILRELGERFDGRCKILRLDKNRGPAAARNAGWNAASQNYVAFLDADDAWNRAKLRLQMRVMLQDTEIALSGHTRGMHEQLADAKLLTKEHSLSFQAMLFRNKLPTASVIIKRDLPQRFDEKLRYCEDYDLWLRILADGSKGVFIPTSLATAFKQTFGDSGLSSNLYAMELAQTRVYKNLYARRSIRLPEYVVLVVWSRLRFSRRIAVSLVNSVERFVKRRTFTQSHNV